MNNVHPLFVAVLTPFSPAPILIEADDETTDAPSSFADDREDIGYEMARQRRIDNEPKEPTC